MRASSFFAVSIVVVAIGCGGAVDTGLFGDPTGGQDSPDAAASSDAAGHSSDGGKIFSDGGGGVDGGVTVDSGPFPTDASMAKDTNVDPPNRIDCNTSAVTCTLGTQVCCRSVGGPASFNCVASTGCNAIGNLPIPCDDADDCTKLGHPGELCCAHTTAGKADNVSCVPEANCGSASNSTNLCDPLAADPCPNGGTCQPSVTTLPGFHICF